MSPSETASPSTTTPACAAGAQRRKFALTLGLELVDLTRDGNTTQGVLADLAGAPASADAVTLTGRGRR
jgi:hypothetical protein